jgi:murein DD-endopeptidase MepM/ murein hydrolase activator NlpD
MSPSYPEAAAKPGRGWRPFLLAALLAAGVAAPAAAPVAAPVAVAERRSSWAPVEPRSPRVPALSMPVTGPLLRGFDQRAGPYGPGHRGIDIAAPVGELVRAPTAGRVVFAGPVAGVNWVTLVVAPGVLVTLGPLLDPVVSATRVRSKAPVGRIAPGHTATREAPTTPAATAALHLSVRVDGVYVDPLVHLVDRPRPRLVPLPTPGGLPGG